MARRPERKPAKKSDKKRRQPAKKPTVRNASRRPERRPVRRPVEIDERDEDMLAEFSDDTNDFFVDEQRQRPQQRQRGRAPQNQRGRAPKKSQRDSAPRKNQRPKQKKEKERKPMSPTQRKIIRILSYGIIISVVLVVGVVLSLTVLFKTQVYEVTGNTKYTEQELIEACGIKEGENIFLAPKGPAEKRIKDKFPYIEDVDVGFNIPDTITIGVVEAVEGYFVKLSNNDYLVISTKGRILDRVTDTSGYDLPIFIGPQLESGEIGDYVSYEDDTVVTIIEEITQTFADNGYQGITEIDATNTADVSFTYQNRIKVKLGIPEDLDYKVRTAMTIIVNNLDKNSNGTTTGVLDVSRCNTTKRSYFNEEQIAPTEASTETPTDGTQDSGAENGGSGEEYSYEYIDDFSAGDDVYTYNNGYNYDGGYTYEAQNNGVNGDGNYYGAQ